MDSTEAHGPVGSTAWFEDIPGMAADADELLVGDADDVKREVVPWIPPLVSADAAWVVGLVIGRRLWRINVAQPPRGIPFLHLGLG